MQDTLFWHNSEVLRVTVSGTDVDVVMSAAAVERAGAGDTLSGFIKPLTLRCHGARISGGEPADCIGAIAQGELRTAAGSMQRQLALPWRHPGPLQLSLDWRNGSHLLIEADGAECVPDAHARFMSSYAC